MPNPHLLSWTLAAALAAASAAAHAQPAETPAPSAAAAQRASEREAIAQQRQANQAQLLANEKICYQQFAVTDCLKNVRRDSRLQEQALHKRELVINAAERAERVQQQEANRAQKRKDHADKAATMLDAPPAGETLEQRDAEHRDEARQRAKPGASEAERAAQREQQHHDAAQRAAQQNDKRASKARELDRRNTESPAKVDEARGKYDAKQTQAIERKREYEERMKKLQDDGKVSRPLGDPPAP
ncbi:hypothetical protein GCM10027082_37280 [Comamonas humi]